MFFITLIAAILAPVPSANTQPPVVVELFTSQGCSSCPPAESFLRELAADDGVIALEWHVDYWDQLNHGRSGKWKDPYSNPAYTARQRAYNVALRGRGAVYTPQSVINGSLETVGSRRMEVRKMMKTAHPISIIRTRADEGRIIFETPNTDKLDAHFVIFEKKTKTSIKGGENHGREALSAHVVVSTERLAFADQTKTFYQVEKPGAAFGCAILLQEANGGPVRAAAYCPS